MRSQGSHEARRAHLTRDRRFAALCLVALLAGLALRANADGFDLGNPLRPLPLTGYDLLVIAVVGVALAIAAVAVRRSAAKRHAAVERARRSARRRPRVRVRVRRRRLTHSRGTPTPR